MATVLEPSPTTARPPKLLDRVREANRLRHGSRGTEKAYVGSLLFLYCNVLPQDLPWLDDVVRAKRPRHLPVVLARNEVHAVIAELPGTPRLMATLLYGSALRPLECCRPSMNLLGRGNSRSHEPGGPVKYAPPLTRSAVGPTRPAVLRGRRRSLRRTTQFWGITS